MVVTQRIHFVTQRIHPDTEYLLAEALGLLTRPGRASVLETHVQGACVRMHFKSEEGSRVHSLDGVCSDDVVQLCLPYERREGSMRGGRRGGRGRERVRETQMFDSHCTHVRGNVRDYLRRASVYVPPSLKYCYTELTMIQALRPCCSGVADDIDLSFSSVCRGSGHFGVASPKTMCSSGPHSNKSAT